MGQKHQNAYIVLRVAFGPISAELNGISMAVVVAETEDAAQLVVSVMPSSGFISGAASGAIPQMFR